jgi:hypothetical protein
MSKQPKQYIGTIEKWLGRIQTIQWLYPILVGAATGAVAFLGDMRWPYIYGFAVAGVLIALGVALFIQNLRLMSASAKEVSPVDVRDTRSLSQQETPIPAPVPTLATQAAASRLLEILSAEAKQEFMNLSDGEREAVKQIYINNGMMEREVRDFLKARRFISYDAAYQPLEQGTMLVKKSFVGRLYINPRFKDALEDLLLMDSTD